jgi:hypothetical protein
MAQKPAAIRVEVPAAGQDKPRIGRVLVITLIGFAVGVLWPRLAGVKLVPSAPVEGSESNAGAEPAASDSAEPEAPPAAKSVPASEPEQEPAAPQASDRVKVSEPKVTSCRDAKGERHSSCDAIDIDASARPKILALAACKGAESVQGTLSVGLELDFATGKVSDVLEGKSTKLPKPAADALIECAKKEFSTLSLKGVKHEKQKYTVFYIADFLPPGAKADEPESASEKVTAASGRATVGWEVAIVREHPKDGEIIARVMRGTRVVVTGRDGDWYRIKFDAKGSEGWVFRTAIGM